MMKKILMSVYAACALLVIIGSLLWFVFTLHSDSAVGKTEALNNFKVFTQHTGEILSESAQKGNSAWLQVQLEQLCRNYSKYVQTVLIRDSAGIVFIWPKNTDVFSYNEQYVVEVKNLPLFVTAAQTHIPIKETGNTVTVHAALKMIPLETVLNRGQIVFFLLLLIVLMTVMVLIFSYIGIKPAAKKPVFTDEEQSSKTGTAASTIIQADIVHPSEYPAEQAQYKDEIVQPVKTSLETDTSTILQDTHQTADENPITSHAEPTSVERAAKVDTSETPLPLHEQLESLNRLHLYDDERVQQNRPECQKGSESTPLKDNVTVRHADADIDRQASSNASEPDNSKTADAPKMDVKQGWGAENYGLFENHTQTPKTGTEAKTTAKQPPVTTFENTPLADTTHNDNHSLEQATLIEELTTAITETAVAEEDLTLMLIHATDISHDQQIIHLLRATLDRIHKIFIFNKDTLGLIIFYAPLDQAMQIASTLYDEIHALLKDHARTSLGVGLTTRAGRLIPAPRMIEEAAAAISKATEEGCDPIVAFRVNPDKYRRCLARLS